MIDFSKLKVLTAAERQRDEDASPARSKRILNGAASGAAKA